MRDIVAAFAVAASLVAATPAFAHFQLIYTPEVNLEKAGEVPLKLLFWHPLENGAVMDMGLPQEFFSAYRGKRTDLKATLKPVTFQGAENSAAAFDASVSVKRNGDYALVVVPAPYLEASEDIYIQQIAKAYLNVGAVPTDWHQPVGLPAEIVPMTKPYGAIAGSTFTGRVLSEGKPVAGAAVEVEYVAAEPDMKANRPGPVTAGPVPGGAITAVTDAQGVFTFGIPRAGFWGFAALGVGPKKTHEGKELSQDAVLWVRAHDFPRSGQ